MQSSDPCPVCLETLQDPLAVLVCGHRYCESCIQDSIRKVANETPSCPVCREPVREYELRRASEESLTKVLVVTAPPRYGALPNGPRPVRPVASRGLYLRGALVAILLLLTLFVAIDPQTTAHHCHLLDNGVSAVCYYASPGPPQSLQPFCFPDDGDDAYDVVPDSEPGPAPGLVPSAPGLVPSAPVPTPSPPWYDSVPPS
jgi:hypothetical protein